MAAVKGTHSDIGRVLILGVSGLLRNGIRSRIDELRLSIRLHLSLESSIMQRLKFMSHILVRPRVRTNK